MLLVVALSVCLASASASTAASTPTVAATSTTPDRTPVPHFINTRGDDVAREMARRRTVRCPTPSMYPSYHEIVAVGRALAKTQDRRRALEARRCYMDAMDLYLTRLGLYGQSEEEARLSATPEAAQSIAYAQTVLRNAPQYSTLPAGLPRDPRITDPLLLGGGVLMDAPSLEQQQLAQKAGINAAAAGGATGGISQNGGVVSPTPLTPGATGGFVSGNEAERKNRDRLSPDDPDDDPNAAAPYVPLYARGGAAEADAAAAAALAAAAEKARAEGHDGVVATTSDQANNVNSNANGNSAGNSAGLPANAFLPTGNNGGDGDGDSQVGVPPALPDEPLTQAPYIPSLADFGIAMPELEQSPYAHTAIVADDNSPSAQKQRSGTWNGNGQNINGNGSAGNASTNDAVNAQSQPAKGVEWSNGQSKGQVWRAHSAEAWTSDARLKSRARTVYDLQLMIQQRALGKP